MPARSHFPNRLPPYLRALAANSADAVLLETARFDAENSRSWLFLNPVETIAARELDELPSLFTRVEAALARGLHVAGHVGYECGEHFVFGESRRPGQGMENSLPLAWFGVYEEPFIFDHATGAFVGRTPEEVQAETAPQCVVETPDGLRLDIEKAEYHRAIGRIREYIAAGDTYQVNFTDAVTLPVGQTAAAAFSALLEAQPVSYGALISVAGRHILSFSPELFFRVEDGGRRIVTRPMKGTMPRGLDVAEDEAQATRLRADEKNRAEHVMIVDLLRNDLGRICEMGSVHVEELFAVERYRTLLQMTSTIAGRLRAGTEWYEVFRAMFPSGSITGAPKRRTMEIIRELERGPRGVYTGAIGYISPSGEAAFSVAIRTLMLENGVMRMGVGGGIVADSEADAEYRECLLKARFLAQPRVEFDLIETMLAEDGAVLLMPLHLDRLAASAAYFDFAFDREAVEGEIAAYLFGLARGRYRVRLLVGQSGQMTLTHQLLAGEDSGEVTVRMSPRIVKSSDLFLRHKTTRRELFNDELAHARDAGFDEVLFVNERGELTEGAISTLFVRLGGRLLTPPVSSGVLPGVLRRHILSTDPTAAERILRPEDLDGADSIYIGNAVRGLHRVARLETPHVPALWGTASA